MYSLNIEYRLGLLCSINMPPAGAKKTQQHYAKCLAASKDYLIIKMFKLHILHIIKRLNFA